MISMFKDRDKLFRFVSVVTMTIVMILAIMSDESHLRTATIAILATYNAFAFINLIMDAPKQK